MAELDLGRVVGLDGQDGKDGNDGLSANANLLDNAYFVNPVNQRGQTSYTEQGYTIDRWRSVENNTVSITDNGITATGEIFQPFAKKGLAGAILTAVVMLDNGTMLCKSGAVPTGSDWNNFIITSDSNASVMVTNANADTLRFRITPGGNTVVWAALYRGEYPADRIPEFVPKGYAVELMECQRYFIRIKSFQVAGQIFTDSARFSFTLPMPMRITPTLTLITKGTIICNGVKDVAVTGATFVGATGNRIKISTDHKSQSGWSLQTGVWVDGYFELSADL